MKYFWLRIAGLATVVFLSLSSIPVYAESVNDEEITRRIDFIQTRLEEGKVNAKRWQYSWVILNGGMSYVQLGLATTQTDSDEKNDQFDNVVGGILGLLAAGDLIFNPLNSWNAAEKLGDFAQTTGEEKKAKLAFAEKLLKDCADRQIYGQSWQTHALAGLVSLAGGAAIALDEDEDDDYRYDDGALFFASSMLIAEIQILTMPTRAIKDWEAYSSMSFDDSCAEIHKSRERNYFITASPRGVFCTILF